MTADRINEAFCWPESGRWAVGVSGGADSVAMLCLLARARREDWVVVHIDHELRGQASRDDAAFTLDLAQRLDVRAVVVRRAEMPDAMQPPTGDRLRRLRHAAYQRVAAAEGLSGVLLAHHADDQAETILLRLLRNASMDGLAGMSADGRVGGLRIFRPMLSLRRSELRDYLHRRGITWREDETNALPKTPRNRIRPTLTENPLLSERLLALGKSSAQLRAWVREHAPALAPDFAMRQLADLPDILAHNSARRWLIERGASREKMSGPAANRLIEMARDAASAARQQFPGKLTVERKRGRIGAADAPR